MKALVTGASGFVGYNLTKLLLESGFSVRVMLRGSIPAYLQELPLETCNGDLTDKDSLITNKVVEGCDYLFHVAAH